MDDIFLKIKRPEDFQKFLVDLKRAGGQVKLGEVKEFQPKMQERKVEEDDDEVSAFDEEVKPPKHHS